MTPKWTFLSSLTLCLLAACTATATPTPTLPVTTVTVTIQPATSVPTSTAIPATPFPSPVPTETATSTVAPTATTPPATPTPPSPTAIPAIITDTFGLPMVFVPAGPFLMGSDVWNDNERPSHTVTLNAFYIDQFEVDNTSFAEFLNANGNQIEGYANWVEEPDPDLRIHRVDGVWTPDEGYADHPINEATWYAARAFCSWRGVRLPTEAEWEKAARGTDGRTFPWGEAEPTCDLANFAGCFYDSVPVNSYPNAVSPYGAYNMAGNVMEWVADWYVSPYDTTDTDNPTGPELGSFRIFRGGAWFNSPYQVRTTYRFAKLPVLTYQANGFRCARDAVP